MTTSKPKSKTLNITIQPSVGNGYIVKGYGKIRKPHPEFYDYLLSAYLIPLHKNPEYPVILGGFCIIKGTHEKSVAKALTDCLKQTMKTSVHCTLLKDNKFVEYFLENGWQLLNEFPSRYDGQYLVCHLKLTPTTITKPYNSHEMSSVQC